MPSNSAEPDTGAVTADHSAQIRAAIETDAEQLWRSIALLIRKTCGPLSPDEVTRRTDEVLGEIVRRALSRSESYDPSRAAFPWLIGIAINVLKGQRRDEVRERRLVPQTDIGNEIWAHLLEGRYYESPEGAKALRIDLQQKMERLSPGERRALECRFFQGLEGEELARAMGASTPNAAYVRVCRAIQKLRQQFGPADSEVMP